MVRRSSGSKKGKSDKGLTLNFDGIETTSRVPDGDYAVKVKSVVLEDQKEKGTQYLKFSLAITEGKHAGKTLRHTNSLQPQALFALRNTLEALGFPIPSGAFELDLEAMVGLEMAVAVENEEYNGKDQSRVVDVFSSDDLAEADEDEDGDDEDENEEDENTDDSDEDDDSEDDDEDEDSDDEDGDSDSDDDDDDDVEDYTEEDLKAMDEEELLEAAEEYEVKAKYKGKGDKKKLNKAATIKLILEVIEADDEDEDE